MLKSICCAVFLLYSFNVSSQAWKPKPLETYDLDAKYLSKEKLNLPTATPKIKSMRKIGGFESVQVNTDINGLNTIGDAANEPSIAVNPLNHNQIAIGWRQFNTVTNSFRQAGRSYSDDGGKTWNYQDVFEPGVFRSDPVLQANADGEFYYQSLKVVFGSQINSDDFQADQWKSYDGGKTWVEKTFAYGGDKSWIAIDKTDGLGRGNIYAAWNVAGNNYFPNTYNSSLNNGVSFTAPIQIPRSPIFGTVEVGPEGEVYVFGVSNYNPPQSLGSMYLIISDNPRKNLPSFNQTKMIDMKSNILLGGFINEVGLIGQLYVKVDKSQRQTRGNIYLIGALNPYTNKDPSNVMYTRSTDRGLSFSRAKALGSDESNNWQWFGTASIAPNGRLDVIWYDTRKDDGSAGNGASSRMFYTYSYDGGVTFSLEEVISPRFQNLIGYPIQRKMGDYIDMQSDNLGANIAYTATYNGEQDVYYLYAKPSSVEENPDFPSLMTDNAWVTNGVPSQGILSKTLVNKNNVNNPLLAFDAIFSAKPDGSPIWLIATGEIPLFGDSYSIPLFMPTGDLSTNGQAVLAIGLVTKKRLRDDSGDLIDGVIEYTFDMTDEIKMQLQESLGVQYDEMFFDENPFHNIKKTLVFNSLLPKQQRKNLCNINGQVLTSEGEKNEGRIQYSYFLNGVLNVFGADFTYKKNLNSQGVGELDLDENGLAIPTWEVLNSSPDGVQEDNSVTNTVVKPNGGLGFFVIGKETGVTEIGDEQISVTGTKLISKKPDSTTEIMSVLANNAYCGEMLY